MQSAWCRDVGIKVLGGIPNEVESLKMPHDGLCHGGTFNATDGCERG